MNGYQKRIESKKRQIKKSALKLLEKYELDKITIHQIAEHASVSRATIYKHFGDKENLYHETFKDIIDESLKDIEKIIDGEGDFESKFREITSLKGNIMKTTSNSYVSMSLGNTGELEGVLSEEQRIKSNEMVKRLFKQGREEGFIGQDISDESILDLLKVIRSGLKILKDERDPIMMDIHRLMAVNDLFINAIKAH